MASAFHGRWWGGPRQTSGTGSPVWAAGGRIWFCRLFSCCGCAGARCLEPGCSGAGGRALSLRVGATRSVRTCARALGQAVRAGETAPKDHSLTCVCVCDVHSVRVCARDSAFFGGSLPALARAGPANALTSVEMTSHGYKKAKLNLPADQRKALFRSLTTEVIRHGRITTTQHRAKAIRGEVRPSFRCRCLRRGTEVGWARAPRPQWDSARTAVSRCGLGRAGLGREWCTLRAARSGCAVA